MSGAASELDPTSHADWIIIARKWARGVCRDNLHWDPDDLEGYILLDMVRWPSDTTDGLWARARSSTKDWMRERLGRGTTENPHLKGQMFVTNIKSLDEVVSVNPDMADVTLGDLIPSGVSVDDEVFASILGDWLPLVFDGRDALILRRVVEGYGLREIGEELGVTESRVSQILINRLRPKVKRMLALDFMRQDSWAAPSN